MKRLAGQAGRGAGWLVHRLAHFVQFLLVFAAVGIGALAIRLSAGPIQLAWLANWASREFSTPGGTAVHVERAALAWEGWQGGVDRPLDIRLTGMVATAPDGRVLGRVPAAAVSLSLGELLLGRWVPRAIAVDAVHLRVLRQNDGTTSLDLGDLGSDLGSAEPQPGAHPLSGLLAEVGRPRGADRKGQGAAARWSQLRRVRLTGADIVVVDRQLGLTWEARRAAIDLTRRPQGGVDGTADATVSFAGQTTELHARATLDAGGAATRIEASFSAISPAALARNAPFLAGLAAVDAPLSGRATVQLGPALALQSATLHADLGSGTVRVGPSTERLSGATMDAALAVAPYRLTVDSLRLALAPVAPGEAGPVLTLRGSAHVEGARIIAALHGDLDRVAFADLPSLWPGGIAEHARDWVTQNITAGTAHDGHFDAGLSLRPDGSDVHVQSATAGIAGDDLTVNWLRPMAPVEHASAKLALTSPNAVSIITQGGVERGTAITVGAGNIAISGLTEHHQVASIALDLSGPVTDTLALLAHKRLKLLSRHPLPLKNPSGTLAGHLSVTLPLEKDVSADDVAIRANGSLTSVHVSDVVAGRDLDHGKFVFEVDNDGLVLSGPATLGGFEAAIDAGMDFRHGPPTQVLERVAATLAATDRQLAAAGFDPGEMLRGRLTARTVLTERRNGAGEVDIAADLDAAALQIVKLGWRKKAGQDAEAAATIRMMHDHITSVDDISVEGAGISVAGSMDFAPAAIGDARPGTLHLSRVVLGDTRGEGSVTFPAAPGDPWRVRVSGSELDLSHRPASAGTPTAQTPAQKAPGTPYDVDARFAEVRVGGGHALTSVMAHVRSDGAIIRAARLDGQSGPGDRFAIAITPAARGRDLSGSAADAGALLRAFGVTDQVDGGKLTLAGRYDDTRADHPLEARAEVDNFRMRGAPAAAKLLQAVSLYGLVDALRGPGLGVSKLVAPFRLAGDRLELSEARAFNASLGLTVKGRVDLATGTADLHGTVVPVYFFNALLGKIPLVGKLFSPERGGGVFAADFSLRGKLDDPTVTVNPLSALTPGFLRGVFNGFSNQGATAR